MIDIITHLPIIRAKSGTGLVSLSFVRPSLPSNYIDESSHSMTAAVAAAPM